MGPQVLAAKNRSQAVLFPSRLLILLFTVSGYNQHLLLGRVYTRCVSMYTQRRVCTEAPIPPIPPIPAFQVLYLLPLPWRRLSTASYRCAALASLLNYLFVLYSSHGMPKFNTEVCGSSVVLCDCSAVVD